MSSSSSVLSRPRTRLQARQEMKEEEERVMKAVVGHRPRGVSFAFPATGKLQVQGASPLDQDRVYGGTCSMAWFEGDMHLSGQAGCGAEWVLEPRRNTTGVALVPATHNSYLVVQYKPQRIRSVQTFWVQGVEYLRHEDEELMYADDATVASMLIFVQGARILQLHLEYQATLRVSARGVLAGKVIADSGSLCVNADQPGLADLVSHGGTVFIHARILGRSIFSSVGSVISGMTCTAPETKIKCEATSSVRDFVCCHASIKCHACSTVKGKARSWTEETEEECRTLMSTRELKQTQKHGK